MSIGIRTRIIFFGESINYCLLITPQDKSNSYMKLFIDTHREILSKDTVTSSSSRFTWDEGYSINEVETTTFRARIKIDIYCDNPELYHALGGLINNLEDDLTHFIPEGDVYAHKDMMIYTGLKLINYDPNLLGQPLQIKKSTPDSWLCLERVNTMEDMEHYHYVIISMANEKAGLSLVRSVNISYAYKEVYR